jgi:hypothetical protein
VRGSGYAGPQELVDDWGEQAKRYQRDLHAGQPRRVLVWCEAAGMVPLVRRALEGLPVHYCSGGGEPSVTLIHAEAEAFADDWLRRLAAAAEAAGFAGADDAGPFLDALRAGEVVLPQRGLVLYVGDLDKHGRQIEDRTGDDLCAMVSDLDGAPPAWQPVALTSEQVAEYQLPEKPDAPGDYQVEALPPDVLVRLVREAAEAAVDQAAMDRAAAQLEADRAELQGDLTALARRRQRRAKGGGV